MKGPVLDLPLLAIGSCRGDPTNVDIPAATEQGIPVLRAPGRNADAVAELTVGLILAVNRGIVRADRDVREGQVWRDGTIPYQRFRAWQLAGRTAGLIGLGAVGPGHRSGGSKGLGMRVIALRPVRRRRHALARRPARRGRRRLDARRGDPRDRTGSSAREQFARMKNEAIYINTRPRAAARHRRARRRAASRARSPAPGLDHFVGENLAARPPAVLDGQRRAHARTSAARPGTPR